ncbi:hypothetical protein GCM10027059_30100 [Myceligenerans halotolerans]
MLFFMRGPFRRAGAPRRRHRLPCAPTRKLGPLLNLFGRAKSSDHGGMGPHFTRSHEVSGPRMSLPRIAREGP